MNTDLIKENKKIINRLKNLPTVVLNYIKIMEIDKVSKGLVIDIKV